MSTIPTQLHISREEGQSIEVIQTSLTGRLGQFDPYNFEITLHADQPEVGKHIILMHELIHAAAAVLIQCGAIKRQPDEAFVTNAAPLILSVLTRAGLYTGISEEQWEEFVQVKREASK